MSYHENYERRIAFKILTDESSIVYNYCFSRCGSKEAKLKDNYFALTQRARINVREK